MKRFAASFRSLGLCLLLAHALEAADERGAVDARLDQLSQENRRLQQQVEGQQQVIDRLAAEVAEMRGTTQRQDRALQQLQEHTEMPEPVHAPAGDPKVRIAAEVGLAFFRTGSAGQFPNSEFRVDDAKISLEAQIWKNAYAFAELNLMTREANDESAYMGELYVDFEDVSALWHVPALLAVRVGRFNIPFGEEYQSRSVLTNPLISHSVADLWGIDEGVEAYGRLGPVRYVVAVQNGGHGLLHDYTADKSVAGRVEYNPARWLHLSASAMRTGELSTSDPWSELWIGNGFFRALGAGATSFHASLYEADAIVRWDSGRVGAAAGWIDYDDNAPAVRTSRQLNYQSIEALQNLAERFYLAARYSAIRAADGYPLVGWGSFGRYFPSGAPLTEKLERWSLGVGYKIGPPLVLKFEYALERGRLASGALRDHEDLLSTELGLKF